MAAASLSCAPGQYRPDELRALAASPRDGRPRGALPFPMGVGAWGAVPFRRFPSRFLLLLSSPLVLVAAGAAGAGISGVAIVRPAIGR